MTGKNPNSQKRDRKGVVALSLVGLVAGMVGLSFAAVPLYQMFCQTTGYGGTTRKADAAPNEALDRTITVRFDANVDPKLPWKFEPVQRVMEVKIGESALAFFRATNDGDQPIVGTAGFNVAPQRAGQYFTKIECFCFTEQRLAAGESVEMPVTFFVDPKIVDNESTGNISEITLSYTFYRSGDQSGVAQVKQSGSKSGS